MKILQINKFNYITGGTSRYFIEVSKLLKIKSHNLAYFSMHDLQNIQSEWSQYFVSNISFKHINCKNGLNIISRMIYSVEARKKISHLLDVFKPDIAHIHNIFHHISPSVLLELKTRHIPIVHTVGNYHLISPHHNNLFHEEEDGHICEVSKIHRFYNTMIHKCIKNSYIASFAEVLEQYIHYLFGFYTKNVDIFISPSEFMRSKLIEYKIPKNRIVILPYFVDNKNYHQYNYSSDNNNLESYILFFGRLFPEKGLRFLVKVMQQIPSIKLKIIGKGPEGKILNKYLKDNNITNVEVICKFFEDIDLKRIIAQSRFTIFPSVSYEIFGISVLESYASGKPVIASHIGALPEIVVNSRTGFLFKTENIDDCTNKIIKLWNNPGLCKKLGRNAKDYVEKRFNPESHYNKLMDIYSKAIEMHK